MIVLDFSIHISRSDPIIGVNHEDQLLIFKYAIHTGVYTGSVQTTHGAHKKSGRNRPSCPHTALAITSASFSASIRAEYLDSSARGAMGEASGTPILVSKSLTFTSETGTIQLSSNRTPLKIGDTLTVMVHDQDLNVNPNIPETNRTGLVVVYGNGWGCNAGAYPTCSTSILADGSEAFHSCTGFLPESHACLNPLPPCPTGAEGTSILSCAQADWEHVVMSENGCNTGERESRFVSHHRTDI